MTQTEVFQLVGSIGVDMKDADNSIDKTTNNAKKSTDKMIDYYKKAAAVIGAVFAIDKIIDFGVASVEAAASAQAIESQFSQVFDGIQIDATDSLNAIADETGMLPNRLKGAFIQMAAFAKTTGMETADALALSDRATRAAADGAAFYDKSVESMTESLQSFLKGNYANDAALGISATETTRNAMANKLYGKSFIELAEDQKQLTLLTMVEEGNALSGALGQASREADTYGNQVGNLKQAWTDFKVLIGTPMMGVVIDGLKGLSEWVQSAGVKFQELTVWISENQTTIELIGVAIGTLTALIIAYNIQQGLATANTTLWAIVTGTATGVATAFGTAMTFLTTGALGPAILVIGALVAAGVLLYRNWDTVKEKLAIASDFFVDKGLVIKDAMMKPMEIATQFIHDMIEKIKGFFKFEWSLPKLKLPHVKISGEFSLLPPKVPSFGIDWYKEGGIMTGPTLFGLDGMRAMGGGEAGHEAILPLNRDTLGMIGEGIANASGSSNQLEQKVDILIELFRTLLGRDPESYQLMLESGVIAGELMPHMNKLMGKETDRKKRGG